MRTYYKLADFLALNIDINEYQLNQITKAKKLSEEVSKFHPATTIVEIYKDEDTDKIYFAHTHVFLDIPNLEYKVSINYMEYSKHYVISAYQGYCNFDYITSSDRHQHDETEKLNKIGKLSSKKIQAYISAIEETYNTLCTINDERVKKVKVFKESLKGLDVHYYRDQKNGYIRKGGLEYEFKIEDSGYIDQRIKIDAPATLESFLKMADNKL